MRAAANNEESSREIESDTGGLRSGPQTPVGDRDPAAMTTVRRHAFVPFSAAQMYQLVNDIEAYPEFLPWCVSTEILAAEPTRMRARLRIKKGPLDASFTTDNQLLPERGIALALVDGPFSRFHGRWHFEPADGGCLVSLDLQFEFRGRVLGRVLATAFKPIADSMVDAFKTRAFAIYAG